MGNIIKLMAFSSSETTKNDNTEISMSMEEEILSVPITNNMYDILKIREKYLCCLLQKKFGCITVIKNIWIPSVVYLKSLKEGVQVSVWVDDLTRHQADALVNVANEHLHHLGGLAFTLLKAGGPEIEAQSKHFIENNGPLSVGQIAVTSGGRLPCKQVIHTVSPRWAEDQREECCLKLETAIINILKYVNAPENNIKSLAFPALCSEMFDFPQDLCAQVIVQTVKNFIQLAPLFGYLQEIHLVNLDKASAEIMARACEEQLGRNDLVPLRETSDYITINDLCLQIKKGSLEKEQAAILVNSVVVQDDLSQGIISKALLEKAGPSMQKQFLSRVQKFPTNCPKLICTKGYNIPCEFVFHVMWPSYNGGNTQQALKAAVSESLFKTQEQQFASVSFPPLGIEDLHLPKDEVADIMVEEIIHFAQEQPGKKPVVCIVIPPADIQVYEAFCTKLESVKNKMEERMECSNVDSVELQTDIQANAECEKNGPCVELIGCSCETLEEAGCWLKNIIQVEETQHIIIRDHNILNLGESQLFEVSYLQQRLGITILESLIEEGAVLEVRGDPQAVIDATFAIEFMLQITAKRELLKTDGYLGQCPPQEGHREMARKDCYQVIPIESYLQEFKNKEKQFEKAGLRVLKIEKIYNPVLESTFQEIKKKIEGKNTGRPVCHRLYYRIPARYCSLVCGTGFQKTYSFTQDQKYGAGIYFCKNPRNLVTDTTEKCEMDHLICVFEAEVVTGLYTRGNQSDVVPSLINANNMKLYNSVVNDIHNPDIFVIFNRHQALPLYLLTCSMICNMGPKSQ